MRIGILLFEGAEGSTGPVGHRRSGRPAVLMLPIAFDPTERITPYSERPEEIRIRFHVRVRS